MTRPMLYKSFLQALVAVAILILCELAVMAQDSASGTTAVADSSKQKTESRQPPANEASIAPVTVLENTLIRVITNESLNSKRSEPDAPISFTVSEDVFVGDVLAIPRGAIVHGVVIKSKKAGVLTGSAELTLKLVSLSLGGRSYPLDSYQFKVTGASKTKPTESKALRGAEVGAVVGSLVGGVSTKSGVANVGSGNPVSAATFAAVGAGVGTMVSAATPGPGIRIPSESQVDFYLALPVTVIPVGAKEAARLAQGLHPGGPTLYLRGDVP